MRPCGWRPSPTTPTPTSAPTSLALAGQDTIPILGFDESLRHRLGKRVTNSAAEFVPTIVAEADRLLAAIPEQDRDFDAAKAAVMEVTSL